MDDETPEMEAITNEMREIMRVWIADPDNPALKARYRQLQDAYQQLFLELKGSDWQPNEAEPVVEGEAVS